MRASVMGLLVMIICGPSAQAVAEEPTPLMKKCVESASKGGEEMVRACTLAIESGHAWPMAYTMRGGQYWFDRRYDLAMSDANHAIAMQPDDYVAYELRAEIYESLGQRDMAIADSLTALKYFPTYNLPLERLHRYGVPPP